jgi:hypothetical protein
MAPGVEMTVPAASTRDARLEQVRLRAQERRLSRRVERLRAQIRDRDAAPPEPAGLSRAAWDSCHELESVRLQLRLLGADAASGARTPRSTSRGR